MDYYQELLKSLGKAEDVEYLFRTQRPDNPKYPGSFYAQHANNSTSGFREPSNEAGKGYKLQPKSYRTLYLDPRATDAVHSWLRDQNIATYAVPEAGKDGKPTGHLLIKSAEQQKHGKNTLSKDQTLTRVPYSKEPVVGYHPLEFGPSAASPRGSSGDVHYGNKITEVHPRPSRLGKAGIAATLLGGAGAASAGDYRRAAADIAESLLPMGLTPSTLAPGTLSPEQRAQQDAAYKQKLAEEREAKMRAQALLRSGVPMPDEYRRGGRVRMI